MSKKRDTGTSDRHPDDTYLRVAQEDDARLQPDPELALSSGRASGTQMWMVALAVIAITGLVLYGLSQSPQTSQTAATPPAATTGAAPSSDQPAVGTEQTQGQQAAPEQPAQDAGKQGPSDSAR